MSQKDAYTQKVQEQLDTWKAQVDQFKIKSADMAVHSRAEYQKHLDALEAHGETVKQQLKLAQQASDQAWADMKLKADQAWDTLHDATKKAFDRFK